MRKINPRSLAVLAVMGAALCATSAAAADLKLGVVMATTGTYSFVGDAVTKAAILGAEQLQASKYFGNDSFTLLTADNASSVPQALTLINRMARQDKVLMIMGPVATSEAMAVGPVAADLKTPLFTTSSTPAVSLISPWVFRSGERPDYLYKPLADYAVQKLHVKRCASVTIRDNAGYVAQTAVFNKTVADQGVTIVGDETILSSDTDFAAIATKIAFDKPDCLFISTPPEQGANVVAQAKEAGLPADAKLFGNTGMSSTSYIKTGGKAIEGTYYPAQFVPTGINDLSRKFIADYTAKYGSPPDDWAAVGYSMLLVAAHAIKDAGPNPTPETVRDAMARIKDVPVVIGQGTFSVDADRDPFFGATVLTIRDGKFVQP